MKAFGSVSCLSFLQGVCMTFFKFLAQMLNDDENNRER